MPDPEECQIKALQEKVRKLETKKANRRKSPDRPTSRDRKINCKYQNIPYQNNPQAGPRTNPQDTGGDWSRHRS